MEEARTDKEAVKKLWAVNKAVGEAMAVKDAVAEVIVVKESVGLAGESGRQ